ncbi:CobW family GTP-binding protein [Bacillus cihuensis]|uniref:CobW family GTP-binding protein n=1 Tax=Bacillus cihuensis TaxID=1208599 RepID=UPI000413A5A6|nr:GTP-binding protein [Bacillus cihuensis]
MEKMTEVYILGGFLGSGKTTLLKEIIQQENEAGRKAAILLNELGSVSVESAALGADVPFKELLGGCICCTIQDKLEVQIHSLLSEHELDAIYIETTGAAHPVEVLDSIMSPLFAKRLNYRGIITVVDLLRFKDRNELSPQLRQLLVEQVQHADFILLNKQDLVSDLEAGQLVYSIQAINPEAISLLTTHAKISLSSLQKMKMNQKNVHSQLNVHSHLHLQAIVHTFKKAMDQTSFEEWLRALPATVYRMKGYVSFTNSEQPYLFQYSYGMPIYMNELIKMPLNLVIIGEQLNEKEIRSQLTALEEK